MKNFFYTRTTFESNLSDVYSKSNLTGPVLYESWFLYFIILVPNKMGKVNVKQLVSMFTKLFLNLSDTVMILHPQVIIIRELKYEPFYYFVQFF